MSSSATPSKLRAQHPEEKRQSDFQNHLWAYLIVRRLSFYLAPVFIRLGFSANQITLLGGGVLLVGLGSLVLTTSYSVIVFGALLINLWYVLDFVDGVVARYNDTESELGAFVDWFIGICYHTLLPFAVAVVLFRTKSFGVGVLSVMFPAVMWFGIATIDAVSRLLRRIVVQKVDLLVPGNQSEETTTGITLGMIVSAVASFKSPLLLLAALAGILDVWLLCYTLFSLGVLGPAIILQLNYLASHEREK